ncbi:hypothetical protein [Methylobacter sp.]|uniref:hypothetical protein n=1 Tax=Methylobacter sp. TaxID=2051955 RepID=UPI002FDD19AE
MTQQTKYALILNTVIEIAKARGMESPGSNEAALCYDLIEAAISEAEVWDVPLEEIGLDNFDTNQLLQSKAA